MNRGANRGAIEKELFISTATPGNFRKLWGGEKNKEGRGGGAKPRGKCEGFIPAPKRPKKKSICTKFEPVQRDNKKQKHMVCLDRGNHIMPAKTAQGLHKGV